MKLYRSKCDRCGCYAIFSWQEIAGGTTTTCTHCGDENVTRMDAKSMAKLSRELDAGVAAFATVSPELRALKKPGDHVSVGFSVKPPSQKPQG